MMYCNENQYQEVLRSFFLMLERKGAGEELWMLSSFLLIIVLTGWLILEYWLIVRKMPLWFRNIIFVVLSLAVISIIQLPNLARYSVHINECQHIGEAMSLADNMKIWLSVDGTTIGALPIYLVAMVEYFGFGIDYFTIKIANIVIWIFTIILVYKSFRLKFDVYTSRLLSTPLICIVALFNSRDYVGYNGETLTILILTAAVYFILRSVIFQRGVMLDSFLAGAFLVLAPFSKFQAGPVAFILGVYYLYFIIRSKNSFIPLLFGVVSPLVILVIYLSMNNLYHDFWESYIINNLHYTSKSEGLNNQKGILVRMVKFLLTSFKAPETRIFYFMALVLFLYQVFVTILKLKLMPIIASFNSRYFYWTLVLFSFFSIIVVIVPGNVFLHYALFMLVPIVLIVGFILPRGFANTLKPFEANLLFIGLFVLLPSMNSIFSGNRAFEEILSYEDNSFREKSDAVEYICETSKPDDKIALWGWESCIFVETGLNMGTRESQTQRQILSLNQQEYYVSRFINDMERNKPRYFVDTTRKNVNLLDYKIHNYTKFDEVRNYIEANYSFVLEDRGISLFIRK